MNRAMRETAKARRHALDFSVSQMVPCARGRDGLHLLTMCFSGANVLVHISAPCQELGKVERDALIRLGGHTCDELLPVLVAEVTRQKPNYEKSPLIEQLPRQLKDAIDVARDGVSSQRVVKANRRPDPRPEHVLLAPSYQLLPKTNRHEGTGHLDLGGPAGPDYWRRLWNDRASQVAGFKVSVDRNLATKSLLFQLNGGVSVAGRVEGKWFVQDGEITRNAHAVKPSYKGRGFGCGLCNCTVRDSRHWECQEHQRRVVEGIHKVVRFFRSKEKERTR